MTTINKDEREEKEIQYLIGKLQKFYLKINCDKDPNCKL